MRVCFVVILYALLACNTGLIFFSPYRLTGNSFAPQFWYNCKTCNLVADMGCCEVCIRKCHEGHEISKGRYMGSCFCDCSNSNSGVICKALTPYLDYTSASTKEFGTAAAVVFEEASGTPAKQPKEQMKKTDIKKSDDTELISGLL